MSSLIVSNLSDGTLSIPTTYVTNGSAKAWVNFNGTGTIAARDSFNVSSLTDNATGIYAVNFTSAFANTNYGLAGTATLGSTFGVDDQSRFFRSTSNVFLTGSISIGTVNPSETAFVDTTVVTVSTHGDLA